MSFDNVVYKLPLCLPPVRSIYVLGTMRLDPVALILSVLDELARIKLYMPHNVEILLLLLLHQVIVKCGMITWFTANTLKLLSGIHRKPHDFGTLASRTNVYCIGINGMEASNGRRLRVRGADVDCRDARSISPWPIFIVLVP